MVPLAMARGDGTSAAAVRAAYPFTGAGRGARVHWACLLECGHTVELDLEPGTRPRRLSCPRCRQREVPTPSRAAAVEPGLPEQPAASPSLARSPDVAASPDPGRRRARRDAGVASGRAGHAAARPGDESRQLGFWFDLDE